MPRSARALVRVAQQCCRDLPATGSRAIGTASTSGRTVSVGEHEPSTSTTAGSRSAQKRHASMPAEQMAQETRQVPRTIIDKISVNLYGAVNPILPEDEHQSSVPRGYVNEDGKRIEDGRYAAFVSEISSFIPTERQFRCAWFASGATTLQYCNHQTDNPAVSLISCMSLRSCAAVFCPVRQP